MRAPIREPLVVLAMEIVAAAYMMLSALSITLTALRYEIFTVVFATTAFQLMALGRQIAKAMTAGKAFADPSQVFPLAVAAASALALINIEEHA